MRAFRARRLVQHDIALGVVFPVHTLDPKTQAFGIEVGRRIRALFRRGRSVIPGMDFHPALLHQTGTYTTGSKPLRIKNVLQLHGNVLSGVNGNASDLSSARPLQPACPRRETPSKGRPAAMVSSPSTEG
ncbi:hypothetical protein D3C71_1670090 [compost metagenome]